ncbi:MAG: hypothetical protein AAFO69_04935 [Bacteroidota bacterium]
MSQFNPVIGTGKSGTEYRTDDNLGKQALMSNHKGATAPTYASAGMTWLDDTSTPWILKMYDGSDWIPLGSVNASTNQFTPYINGAALGNASTSTKGLVERATDTEAANGTDEERFITPKQLAANSAGMKLRHTINATSGTTQLQTGIPEVDLIDVVCSNLTFSATTTHGIRIGGAGGLVTSSYSTISVNHVDTVSAVTGSFSPNISISSVAEQAYRLRRVDADIWQCEGRCTRSEGTAEILGRVDVGETLDRIGTLTGGANYSTATIGIYY